MIAQSVRAPTRAAVLACSPLLFRPCAAVGVLAGLGCLPAGWARQKRNKESSGESDESRPTRICSQKPGVHPPTTRPICEVPVKSLSKVHPLLLCLLLSVRTTISPADTVFLRRARRLVVSVSEAEVSGRVGRRSQGCGRLKTAEVVVQK